jgi:hypothetical protein
MPTDLELVSPLATHRAARTSAPRARTLSGHIVLSDSMLNINAGWGELIIDSVVLALPKTGIHIERICRPQIGDHRPQEWIDRLVEQGVSALIVSAGDCATCTSRALRECILAEDAGIPATAIVPAGLQEIIEATLDAWGRPDLQVALFDTPLFALKKEDFPNVMTSSAQHAISILTQSND